MTGIESKLGRVALIATVALIGLNLRPFITSIGPLAAGIQDRTALSLQGMALLTGDGRALRSGNTARILLARPRTWLLMACLGLVNGGYSSVVAWLAPAYQEHGWSAAASGSLLAVLAVSQAATALTLPILARKIPDRRPFMGMAGRRGFDAAGWASSKLGIN